MLIVNCLSDFCTGPYFSIITILFVLPNENKDQHVDWYWIRQLSTNNDIVTFLLRNLLYLHTGPAQDVSTVGKLIIHHPSQANNLAPLFFKPIFFKPFWPRTGLASIWRACVQIADNCQRNVSHVETWVHQHHISNYLIGVTEHVTGHYSKHLPN
jgi:hypothetical protein